MAEPGSSTIDYFHPGSIVKCITCYNKEEQGEVMTFDSKAGILFLSKSLTMRFNHKKAHC